MTKRLDVVVTGDTPIGDVYGPPEELADLVEVMLENGESVPQEWLDLLVEWRANNDHRLTTVEQFHLKGTAGDHDQSTHGRRFKAARGLAVPDGGFTLSAAQLKPMKEGWAVALQHSDRLLLASSAFTNGEPSKRLKELLVDRIDAAQSMDPPPDTKLAVGGWHNPADGKVEVNVTIVFPQAEFDRAKRFGLRNDQIAIANLAAIAKQDWPNAIVDIGGTGGNRDTEDE